VIDRHAIEGNDERHLVAVDLTFADVNWVTLRAGNRTGQLVPYCLNANVS
jgi:hypothetical protein